MAATTDSTLIALSDAYESALAQIDLFRAAAEDRSAKSVAALDRLDDHLSRSLDDVCHGNPAPHELRELAERTRALLVQLRADTEH